MEVKQVFGLIRRPWGVFYLKSKITGQQTRLKTCDKPATSSRRSASCIRSGLRWRIRGTIPRPCIGHMRSGPRRKYPRWRIMSLCRRPLCRRAIIRGEGCEAMVRIPGSWLIGQYQKLRHFGWKVATSKWAAVVSPVQAKRFQAAQANAGAPDNPDTENPTLIVRDYWRRLDVWANQKIQLPAKASSAKPWFTNFPAPWAWWNRWTKPRQAGRHRSF